MACGLTFQMACVPSAWPSISVRFICPLLPCFSIIALALCSLGQSYIHWISCSGNPDFARSFMFIHATIVLKFQLRVWAMSLSEACQMQTLVNEDKSMARLSDALCWPSSQASFPTPWGLTPDRQGSIRLPESLLGQVLWKQEISVQPRESLASYLMAFHSNQHATNRYPNRTKGFWQLVEFIVVKLKVEQSWFATDFVCNVHLHAKKAIRFNPSWSLSSI